MKLSEYLSSHGSQTLLARKIKAQPQLVWQWSTGVRPVPIERCLTIEAATNGVVSRIDLRPNDWREIWPELAKSRRNKHLRAQKQAGDVSGAANPQV